MNPIDNPNEDTEFNDILRKHGVLPPREVAPPSPSPPPSPTLSDSLKDKSPDKLAALAEDENDSDTERVIAAYRRQRMAEIKKQERSSNFGEVLPIGRDDYAREVTEASKVDEPDAEEKGVGTGVVVFLYNSDPQGTQLRSQLNVMAKRYPRTKFLSIVGNKCIENYPDQLQPTLILYRAGDVVAQVVSWGKDRVREPQELEALLVVSKVVSMAHRVQEDDRPAPTRGDRSDDDLDSDRDEVRKPGGNKTQNSKIRGKVTVDDEDSDFDL